MTRPSGRLTPRRRYDGARMTPERPSPPPRIIVNDHPPCPYAKRGLDTGGMSACPAFVAGDVSLVLTVSGGLAPRMLTARGAYCGHLGLQESRRTFGFSSACTHPEGPPQVATIEVMGRRRGIATAPVAETPAAD